MIAEALVMLACYTQKGCAEAGAQYYDQNPDIKQIVQAGEKSLKEAAHPYVAQYALPILVVAYGKEASVKLGAGCSVKYAKTETLLLFRKDF